MRKSYVRFLFFVVFTIALMFLAKWLGRNGVSDAITGGIGFVVAVLIYTADVFIWSFNRDRTNSDHNKTS